jgi:hypothetical protein
VSIYSGNKLIGKFKKKNNVSMTTDKKKSLVTNGEVWRWKGLREGPPSLNKDKKKEERLPASSVRSLHYSEKQTQ